MTDWVEVDKYIWRLDREQIGENHYLPGYYFSDEVEQLHGPFETLSEAQELLKNYCEVFLREN